ncbi:MAG: hypothetical protein ACOY0T_11350 [Myxococcota bacterium]
MADFRAAAAGMSNFFPAARTTAAGERIPKLLLRVGDLADVKVWGKSADHSDFHFSHLSRAQIAGTTPDPADRLITILRIVGKKAGTETLAALDTVSGWEQAHLDIEVIDDAVKPSPEPSYPEPSTQPPAATSNQPTKGDGENVIDSFPDFETVAVGAHVRYRLREIIAQTPSPSERNPRWFVQYQAGSGTSWLERALDNDMNNVRPEGHGLACIVDWQRVGVHTVHCLLQNPKESYSRVQVVRPLNELARKAFASAKPQARSPVQAAEAARAHAQKLRKALKAYPKGGSPAQQSEAEDLADRYEKWANDVDDIVKDSRQAEHHPIKAMLFIAERNEPVDLQVFFVRLDAGARWRLVDYTEPSQNHRSEKVYEISTPGRSDPEDAISRLLDRWKDNNRYYSGEVRYEIAVVPSEGIRARSGSFLTTGSDFIGRLADYLSTASLSTLILAGVGVALLPVPVAGPVVAELMVWSLVAGIASSALTTFNRIHYDEQTAKDWGFDLLQVTALLLPVGAYWARGARVTNIAAFTGKPALDKAIFFGDVTGNTLNGMLVATDLAEQIYDIIKDEHLDPITRTERLQRLLKSAIAAGMIVVIPRIAAERELVNNPDALLKELSRLENKSEQLELKRPPGKAHASEGNYERTVSTGQQRTEQATAKPKPSIPPPRKEMTLREWSQTLTQEILARARKAQPSIRPKLEAEAAKHHGKMEGLKYEYKGAESMERKIHDTATKELLADPTPRELEWAARDSAGGVNDSLRYTITLPVDSYYISARAIIQDLTRSGLKRVWLKDFWTNEGKPSDSGYRGINATFKTPDGFQFELQFHTKESYDLKTATHGNYEERRKPEIPRERAIELTKVNIMLSAALQRPPGGPL